MVKRKVELNIISAEGLKLSSSFGKPHTYAVVWIHPKKMFYTHVTEDGGSSPVWNHKLVMSANNHALKRGSGSFTVQIFHRGHIHDKLIGTAEVPFKEIPEHVRSDPGEFGLQYMAFEIRQPSGKIKGILNLSVRLRETCSSSSSSSCSSDSDVSHKVQKPEPPRESPYGSYPPAPPRESPYGNYPPAPPPPVGYASAYPSATSRDYLNPGPPSYAPAPSSYNYGYPASGPGYNYPGSYGNPQPSYSPAAPPAYYAAPQKKSGHSNLALGAGIAAGALGGLVLGEVVEGIADNAAEEAVENVEYGDDDGW